MSERVVPVLRLAVLCEDVDADRDDRPFALVAPVHTLRWPEWEGGPYVPPTMWLYLQLQDAVGTFNLTAVLREFDGTTDLYRTPAGRVTFDGVTNRIIPFELVIELDRLSFPRPGAYELLVYANHASLNDAEGGAAIPFPPVRLNVFPADGSEGGAL